MYTACHADKAEHTPRGLGSLWPSIVSGIQYSSHLLLDGLLVRHAAECPLTLHWNRSRNSRVHFEPEKGPPEQVDDPNASQRPTA